MNPTQKFIDDIKRVAHLLKLGDSKITEAETAELDKLLSEFGGLDGDQLLRRMLEFPIRRQIWGALR
jgi:hypothetical protein